MARVAGRSASTLRRICITSPRPAGVLSHHRLPRLAGEGLLELLHVGDGADDAELTRRVRIGLGELPRLRLGHVLAPHVGEAEEEALLRREAVDGRTGLAFERLLQRTEGHAGAAVVRGV